jgi:hypothetical protein
MARYRVHRIRESAREQFRWAAHTGGTANVKLKDYEPDAEFEAASPYALWSSMKSEGTPLFPGDVVEAIASDGTPGELEIVKYIGFEPAKWWIPEPRPDLKGKFEETLSSAGGVTDSHSA